MPIEKFICSNCGRQGYPGEEGFDVSTQNGVAIIHCVCGNKIPVNEAHDQLMLSSNIFVRLSEASNYSEFGEIEIIPGQIAEIKFRNVFDFPCKAFFLLKRLQLQLKN